MKDVPGIRNATDVNFGGIVETNFADRRADGAVLGLCTLGVLVKLVWRSASVFRHQRLRLEVTCDLTAVGTQTYMTLMYVAGRGASDQATGELVLGGAWESQICLQAGLEAACMV